MTGTEWHTPDETNLAHLVAEMRAAVTFDYDLDSDGASSSAGYEKSADAMWKAALAAFNWAAREVGATGFQASWAALRFYGEAMNVAGPFMVLKAEDALYPQYDLQANVNGWLREQRGYIAEEAKKHLDRYEADPVLTYTDDDGVEHSAPRAAAAVVAHWRRLVDAGLDAGASA